MTRHVIRAAGLAAIAMSVGLTAALSLPAHAKRKSDAWQVSHVTDPVTGRSTCVVAAYDRSAGLRYSRTGYLYPLVENHPVHGVLVGVSSGGRFRLPTGDIVWRVDDRAFRELKAAENPPSAHQTMMPDMSGAVGNDAAARAIREAMDQTMRMSAGMAATSTMASGDTAREMLAEMVSGHSLIFRAAGAVPEYGLPSANTYRVGQITNKGLKPFPLDASFREGLEACGIGTGAATGDAPGSEPAARQEPAPGP